MTVSLSGGEFSLVLACSSKCHIFNPLEYQETLHHKKSLKPLKFNLCFPPNTQLSFQSCLVLWCFYICPMKDESYRDFILKYLVLEYNSKFCRVRTRNGLQKKSKAICLRGQPQFCDKWHKNRIFCRVRLSSAVIMASEKRFFMGLRRIFLY